MPQSLKNAKILVIGDVMLDRYWWGTVNRISPEAPVPVVSLDETSIAAGGAANVAANIAGLDATPYLVGISGDDNEAELLPSILTAAEIKNHRIVPISGRKTTLKNRIIAHNQQMIRLDQETASDISDEDAETILELLRPLIESNDVVLLSDYGKGFLTFGVTQRIISDSRQAGKTVLVDPKGKDYSKYQGATILTPNEREAANACGLAPESANVAGRAADQLIANLDLKALLVTQGERGMTLYETGRESVNLKATARKVYDVTGAGDTAIATMAVALGSGLSFLDAAKIATIAAGLVVENVGTTAITAEMLKSVQEVAQMKAG